MSHKGLVPVTLYRIARSTGLSIFRLALAVVKRRVIRGREPTARGINRLLDDPRADAPTHTTPDAGQKICRTNYREKEEPPVRP